MDYTVPTREEIKTVLDRMLENIVRSTSFQVIDTATGAPVTDFSKPIKTAAIDLRRGEYGDWNYSFGTALSGMLLVSDITGDARYREYVNKSFDFIFTHLDYFSRQSAEFGRPSHNYRRLLEFHELDDCGAIGAALVRAQGNTSDPRYDPVIRRIDEHIATKQLRLSDGTLARPRPYPVAVWIDDVYMAVSFLTAMGKRTGEQRYFDDAARQVTGMSARLFHEETGLYDHSWFEHAAPYDPIFYWGRGAGWMLMAMTELLNDMPEQHPARAKVLEQFGKAVQGVARVQGSTGLWHQLLDRTDSYLETSASAMFTFAIARGVNRGWIPAVYSPVAQAGWRAVASRVRADGNVDGVCVGTTAAADAVYYYSRPTNITALQGHGAMLMAGAEVMVMVDKFDINRTNNTYYYRTNETPGLKTRGSDRRQCRGPGAPTGGSAEDPGLRQAAVPRTRGSDRRQCRGPGAPTGGSAEDPGLRQTTVPKTGAPTSRGAPGHESRGTRDADDSSHPLDTRLRDDRCRAGRHHSVAARRRAGRGGHRQEPVRVRPRRGGRRRLRHRPGEGTHRGRPSQGPRARRHVRPGTAGPGHRPRRRREVRRGGVPV